MKRIFYIALMLSFGVYSFACPDLEQILAIDNLPKKVNFYYVDSHSVSMGMVELSFWDNENCHTQPLTYYQSIAQHDIPIHFQQIFSILPQSIFDIAKELLSLNKLAEIKAISVKFINTKGNTAKFLDGCKISNNEEECCLPIHCHPSEENCDFHIELPMQKFIF